MTSTSFCIVGTGIVGERIINELLAHKEAEILAIFDEDEERLQQIATKYQIQAVDDYEQLLRLRPDWVYIGTPPVTHASLGERAMNKGLNILCEKPLAHNQEDGQMMLEMAQHSGIQTAMHFPLMYSAAVKEMMKHIQDGSIGQVERIELQAYFPEWPRPWQQNPWIGSRMQGGFIREVFPHFLQLTRKIFGDIVIHDVQTTYPKHPTVAETGVLAIGKTEQHIPLLLNGLTSIGQEEELSFIVYGSKSVLKLRNWSELSKAEKNSPFEILTSFESVDSLIDACVQVKKGDTSNLISFSEGLAVQRIVDQLLEG